MVTIYVVGHCNGLDWGFYHTHNKDGDKALLNGSDHYPVILTKRDAYTFCTGDCKRQSLETIYHFRYEVQVILNNK